VAANRIRKSVRQCSRHAHRDTVRHRVAGTLGDCSDVKVLQALVERLCSSLAQDLIGDGVCAGQVVVKIKRSDFTVKQHTFTLLSPTCSRDELAHVAVKLLHRDMPATVRLVGVKVTQLLPTAGGGGIACVAGSSSILHKAMHASDSAASTICPICLKAITGEPPNVRIRDFA
jgi:hypothetical protein